MEQLNAIVFDLDGTLVDSAPDLHAISSRILREEGLEPYSLEEVSRFIGHGVPHLVRQCLDGRNVSTDPSVRGELLTRFLTYYKAAPAEYARPFPGVMDSLSHLRSRDLKIGICTNKVHDIAEIVIASLGFDKFVTSLVGGGKAGKMKPDPAPLLLCLEEMGTSPENAVYVGDSETDEATAFAASIPFILYRGGYRKKPADEFSAAFSFDDYGTFSARIESEFLS